MNEEKCKFCNLESGVIVEIDGVRRCVLCGREPDAEDRFCVCGTKLHNGYCNNPACEYNDKAAK